MVNVVHCRQVLTVCAMCNMSGKYMIASSPRRYLTVVVLVVVTFLLLYYVNSHRSPSFPVLSPPVPYELPAPTDGHFQWSAHKQHFPLSSLTSMPTGQVKKLPRIQHEFETESSASRTVRLQRRDQIKSVFEQGWTSYKEKAWLRGEFSPISGDTFGGWVNPNPSPF